MADTKEEERIRKMLMDEGKADGSREEKMAQRMLEAGKLSVKEIAEYADLNIDTVKELTAY